MQEPLKGYKTISGFGMLAAVALLALADSSVNGTLAWLTAEQYLGLVGVAASLAGYGAKKAWDKRR